jgi:hypothetical protein
MTAIDTSVKGEQNRCLGRLKARELTFDEIEQVAGGPTYTGISMFETFDNDGDAIADELRFSYSDYSDRP